MLSIKAVFPNGLNESVKMAFPDISPIIKPEFVLNARLSLFTYPPLKEPLIKKSIIKVTIAVISTTVK